MSELCNLTRRHAPHGSPGDWWCVGAPKAPEYPPVGREALGEWLYVNLSSRRGADSAPWSARGAETHEYWFQHADAVLALINGG